MFKENNIQHGRKKQKEKVQKQDFSQGKSSFQLEPFFNSIANKQGETKGRFCASFQQLKTNQSA